MRLHILGIGGTFMAGIALLAKAAGHTVSGADTNLYPPMSTQLEMQGIQISNGYAELNTDVDCIIVGNVMRRGMPAIELMLDKQIPYLSGPEWLARYILPNRHVLAVAGTHGKTTTTSMLTWILEKAGLNPGFLIGGIPENFQQSARLGASPYFVIEADEYDSAFFDKRSKFLHYHPTTLILNNLEYDHADIFPNLEAIMLQFQHLLRTVPSKGLVIVPAADANVASVLDQGLWTPTTTFGADEKATWQAELKVQDGSAFAVMQNGRLVAEVKWSLLGLHNVHNALAAIAAAYEIGISASESALALRTFKNVKRRLEIKGEVSNIVVYDDFAHHPTAIKTTLAGLRNKIGKARMIAILEFGSYTMRSGVHKEQIQAALSDADMIVCKATDNDWGLAQLLKQFQQPTQLYENADEIILNLVPQLKPGDHVVVMSNSGFGGIHDKLLLAINEKCVANG